MFKPLPVCVLAHPRMVDDYLVGIVAHDEADRFPVGQEIATTPVTQLELNNGRTVTAYTKTMRVRYLLLFSSRDAAEEWYASHTGEDIIITG